MLLELASSVDMALGMAGTTFIWKISGPGYVPATWHFLYTGLQLSITPLTKMQPKAPDRGGMPVPRRQLELGLKKVTGVQF